MNKNIFNSELIILELRSYPMLRFLPRGILIFTNVKMKNFLPRVCGRGSQSLKFQKRHQQIYGGFEKEVAKAKLLYSPQVITCTILTRVIKGNLLCWWGNFVQRRIRWSTVMFPSFPSPLVEFKKTTRTAVPSEIWRLQKLEWNWAHRLPWGQNKKKGHYGIELRSCG